jgi:5'-nucleotidase
MLIDQAMAPRKTATRAAARDTAASRAWQRMLSGRRLDLLDPSPLDVEIEDIAHGLARVARWNGQTKGAHIFSACPVLIVPAGSPCCCMTRPNMSSAT